MDHQELFADGKYHINGIEGFYSYVKEQLLKYHGISKRNFILYLKEFASNSNILKIYLKEHSSNMHYIGTEESRDWKFEMQCDYSSFFSFWNKCKKNLNKNCNQKNEAKILNEKYYY